MKIFKLLVAMLAIVGMTSCMDDPKSDQVYQFQLPTCVTSSFDNYGTATYTALDVVYTLKYNVDQLVTDISIQGLKINGIPYTTLNFEKVPFKIDEYGSIIINARNVTPSSATPAPTFDEINIKALPRLISNVYAPLLGGVTQNYIDYAYPLVSINYTVQGSYFSAIPCNIINTGNTTVNSAAGTYVQPDERKAIYFLVFDNATRECEITIQGANFAANMPSMNMRFGKLHYTVDPNGTYIVTNGECLEPSIVGEANTGTPNPNYPITNLNLVTDGANNMILTFTCTLKREVNGQQVAMPFDVAVDCKGFWR